MGWLWTSKKRKAELAQQQLLQEELKVLKTDTQRLQAESIEAARQIDEWKSTAGTITQERDALKIHSEQARAEERRQHADMASESNRKQAELATQLGLEQQQREAIEGTNGTLTNSLYERDRMIEELRGSHATELQQRDSQIEFHERRIRELTEQFDVLSRRSSSQIAEQAQQITVQTQQINTLTAQNADLSQQLATARSSAAAQIQELEQQLAQSESHSNNRADQRSALLRNLAEIHRLSEVVSKSELRAESLKLINPTWQEQLADSEGSSTNDVLNQIYSARLTWNLHEEVESA